MNLEQPKSNQTEFLPKLPTREEVLQKITEHLGELKYEIKRELTDDKGVYFFEILTTENDPEGYIREYTYTRKSLKTGADLPPKIYVAYMQDEMPVGGDDLGGW